MTCAPDPGCLHRVLILVGTHSETSATWRMYTWRISTKRAATSAPAMAPGV